MRRERPRRNGRVAPSSGRHPHRGGCQGGQAVRMLSAVQGAQEGAQGSTDRRGQQLKGQGGRLARGRQQRHSKRGGRVKKGLRPLQSLAVLSLDSAVRVSLRGCSGLFSRQRVGRARAHGGWRPVVVVRLSPSKMRAESKGVRAGSEAMHSDTRARKQATSTVPLSSVQPCQAEKGKSTSRSQSTVRHVYKSNYE